VWGCGSVAASWGGPLIQAQDEVLGVLGQSVVGKREGGHDAQSSRDERARDRCAALSAVAGESVVHAAFAGQARARAPGVLPFGLRHFKAVVRLHIVNGPGKRPVQMTSDRRERQSGPQACFMLWLASVANSYAV
jgi:hypothetical protein